MKRIIAGDVLNIGSSTRRLILPLLRISKPTIVKECPSEGFLLVTHKELSEGLANQDAGNRLAEGTFCKLSAQGP